MRLESVLPFMAAVALVASPLLAQEPLPASYQARLATLAHLQTLTLNDVSDLTAKAQSGVPEAQYLLALIYSDGRLMPKDRAVSRQWMLKAAEQEYVPAELEMGEMYLENAKTRPLPDYADADRWLRLAASHGDAEAQFWLGTGYERGSFGAIDYREALKWLRMASAQGLPDAQCCLGGMYEDGEGVAESDEKAALWYRKAADHFFEVSGVWHGTVQMNNMYRDGRLRKDDVEAYIWAAIVGTTGNPPDDTDMKRITRHMTKAQITEAQRRAQDWIRRHGPLQNVADQEARN
jgi:TPR repeat protein